MGANCCCCPPFETPVYFKDSFCRYFNVPCGTGGGETPAPETIWSISGTNIVDAFGTVVFFNEGNCAVTLYVNGTSVGTVQPGTSFSATYDHLTSVGIVCAGTTPTRCKGRVCIDLHYRRPFPER